MLSPETENRLCILVKAIADNERELEMSRQILAEKPQFEPYAAFMRLDRYRKDNVSANDIKDFLQYRFVSFLCRETGAVATTTELYQIISTFSGYARTRLNYKEFLQMILPSQSVLRAVSVQRPNYPVYKYESLDPGVESALKRLILAEIDGNNKLEVYRISLSTRYDFNVFDAFRAIDQDRLGNVNEENLQQFLRKAGYSYRESADTAELFVRRLDRDMDGKLSYMEFVEGIIPYYSQASGKKYYTSRYETSTRYPATEKKPSYRETYYTRSPEPRTEPRHYTREFSADRLATEPSRKVPEYYSPAKTTMASTYRSPYRSVLREQEAGSIYKRLSYDNTLSGLSPSKKRFIEEDLVSTLKDQSRIEKKIEGYKVDLALQPDFNLIDAFRAFDAEAKCYATLTDFRMGLRELGIAEPMEDVEMLFSRYDRDHDGRLRYSDFCEMMLPKDINYASLVSRRTPSGMRYPAPFSTKTQVLFKMMLEAGVDLERSGEGLRQQLRKNPYFDVFDAFQSFDTQGRGYVSLKGVTSCDFIHGDRCKSTSRRTACS